MTTVDDPNAIEEDMNTVSYKPKILHCSSETIAKFENVCCCEICKSIQYIFLSLHQCLQSGILFADLICRDIVDWNSICLYRDCA